MAQPFYYEYTPEPGDSLVSVIYRLYGWSPPSQRYHELRGLIMQMNPHVKNPDRLDTDLALRVPDHYSATPPAASGSPFLSASPSSAETRRRFWAMAWAEHSGLLTSTGSVALGAGSNLLSGGNLDLLRQIGDEYAAYKNGHITKAQYDYRRRLLIGRFRDNMGPFERTLFRGLDTQQAIRIARRGGVPYDHNIRAQVGRLKLLSNLASKGGIVLTGVGVTAACTQIANTVDRREKNEIFVDTVASTSIGAVSGYLVGLFLISNPVGWGAALVFALGGTAASWVAGQGAKMLYDKFGNEVDIVNGIGVDRICRS